MAIDFSPRLDASCARKDARRQVRHVSCELRAALTVPKTTWFFRTRLRLIRSVAASMGLSLGGTPVKMKMPLVPIYLIISNAKLEAPGASYTRSMLPNVERSKHKTHVSLYLRLSIVRSRIL